MTQNQLVCEDIVQNVFMKLFEHFYSIRNKESIGGWIFKTARNEIYTFYRGKNSKIDQFNTADPDEIEIKSPHDIIKEYDLEELRGIILRMLDSMPTDQKEVYLLKEYGGLSYSEIAGIAGITENLVKSRLFKVRQKLIKIISKLVDQ